MNRLVLSLILVPELLHEGVHDLNALVQQGAEGGASQGQGLHIATPALLHAVGHLAALALCVVDGACIVNTCNVRRRRAGGAQRRVSTKGMHSHHDRGCYFRTPPTWHVACRRVHDNIEGNVRQDVTTDSHTGVTRTNADRTTSHHTQVRCM